MNADNKSNDAPVINTVEVGRISVAVLGAGAFGTAMAVVAARNGHDVRLYARDPAQVESINTSHINPKYFSSFTLPESIRATSSVAEACENASLIIHCVPAQNSPDFISEYRNSIPKTAVYCSTAKGLYLKTKSLLSDAMTQAFKGDSNLEVPPLAHLSGPSFAIEIMKGVPTAVVVASKFLYHAVFVQRALSSLSFRIYTTQDTIGVELGGALKNPLAIGAGLIEGMGFGINTTAFFVTRSSLELQKLCVAMGGQSATISGLSGIGDLMLTAFGSLSRNRSFGVKLSQRQANLDCDGPSSVREVLEEMHTTVEGVATASVAIYYADMCGLQLPVFRAVYGILSGHLKIRDAQQVLMGRPLGQEQDVG